MLNCKPATSQIGTSLKAEVRGDSLLLEAEFDRLPDIIELRFYSDRNRKISSMHDVSHRHPDPESREKMNRERTGNVWYPAVDILPERGMEGVLVAQTTANGSAIINGPFYRDKQPLEDPLVISSYKLYNWEIGERSLHFIYHDPGSDVDGAMLSSWKQNTCFHNGYAGSIIIADALFMAGWGWVPLYHLTGDSAYLTASLRQAEITGRLLDEMELIPHSYHIEDEEWYQWYLNEFGFGVEGYNGLYHSLGDPRFRDEGRRYIDRFRKYFEMDDGFWYRECDMENRKPVRPGYATVRGMAWAFEGLVAAAELMPGEGYVDKAEKMADIVLKDQLPNGLWPHSFGRDTVAGISEKGTAIWSYLLHRLYKQSGRQKYLDAARKALVWCMNHQYDGPIPGAYGGIPAAMPNSGITYRAWFNMSCSCTSVFFGLALLEEMGLGDPDL